MDMSPARPSASPTSRPRLLPSRRVLAALALTAGVLVSTTVCRAVLPLSGPPVSPELEARLRASVEVLAGRIGSRNTLAYPKLEEAAAWVSAQWKAQGFAVKEYTYEVGGKVCRNLEVDVAGPAASSAEAPMVLVGAHYDSAENCPGADDNASGTASLLEVTRALARANLPVKVRAVAFTNEEPPYFDTDEMGSRVYAKMARARGDRIKDVVILESLGYYSDQHGSQHYPPVVSWFFPDQANFIGVIGDLGHAGPVRRLAGLLANNCSVPVQRAALPKQVEGIDWSDHASFWLYGYPGLMITDTTTYRNATYHEPTDVPATLDYHRLADVTQGVIAAVRKLASTPPSASEAAAMDNRVVPAPAGR